MAEINVDEPVPISGIVTLILRREISGAIKDVKRYTNLIVDAGKNAIASRLVGDLAIVKRGEITFGSVGTGVNVPAAGDTTLQTEIFRKVLALRQVTTNKALFRLFLTTSEGNGTLKEFALFGEDASAAADSGTMFNRVNIDILKTASETLTIEAEITVG